MNLNSKDFSLALNLATFLGMKYEVNCTIEELDTGAFIVTYSPDHPGVRCFEGKIVWPAGSSLDVMLAFLEGK